MPVWKTDWTGLGQDSRGRFAFHTAGVGAELAAPQRSGAEGQVVIAARQSVQDTVNEVGKEITKRNLDIQPTLAIRQGFLLRIVASKDMVLRPYQPLFYERSRP